MQRTSQSSIIEKEILKHLNKGLTNKSNIYTLVVLELNVARPTVRRVSRDLLVKLKEYVRILGPNPDTGGN